MDTLPKPFIVIVDPDEGYRTASKAFFESEMVGYPVLLESNPIEAINTMHNSLTGRAIFCVALDTPDMDGHRFINYIKKSFRFPKFCLLLTKDEGHDVIAPILEDGILSYTKINPQNPNPYNLDVYFKAFMKYGEQKLVEENTDPLTGLYGRNYGASVWKRDFARAGINKTSTCCIFADMNHLKMVNDTYGHRAGDLAVEAVAKAIQANVRGSLDYVIRYGGDEFVIILPDTKVARGSEIQKRIEEQINQMLIDLGDGVSFHASISTGLSVLRPGNMGKDAADEFLKLVSRADRKMYINKAAYKASLALMKK